MKYMIDNTLKTNKKRVILAGIRIRDKSEDEFRLAMDECRALCMACGYVVAGEIIQNSESMHPKTAFRSGKLEELTNLVNALDADLVIFYNQLKMGTAERISEICGVNVQDRTSLILDIFSQRARSRQAKLQTEMARLQYALPQILNSVDESGHQRGGAVTNRGGGEMRSEIIARKYSARIAELRKELRAIEVQRGQDERRRNKILIRRAALVGYTNAGKSSLLNAMLEKSGGQGSRVMEKDMLFATLDTSVRMCGSGAMKYLLYDTVGFVSDLPHGLVEAFRSTLSAAREADLLIHVIDVSDPQYVNKMHVTEDTLKQIGADHIETLRVYNKIDKAKDTSFEGIGISCMTGEGLDKLAEEIEQRLYPQQKMIKVLLPYDKMSLFDQYRKVLSMHILENSEEGIVVEVSGPEKYVAAFRQFERKD